MCVCVCVYIYIYINRERDVGVHRRLAHAAYEKKKGLTG